MTDILYGIHPVREAIAARGDRIREIWVSRGVSSRVLRELVAEAQVAGVAVRSQARSRLDARAGTTTHQGVVAFLTPYAFTDVEAIVAAARSEEPALILVLDGIQDPQNLGALIRSAYVCGAHGVVIPKDRAARPTAAVDKASAGALEHTRLAQVTNLSRALELCKKEGIWVVGLTMEAERPIFEVDLRLPTALVVGGEARGIRPLVKRSCDWLAAIPQRGRLNSLNAAAAGAVALYETMRQRLTPAAPRR
jgi:23S rRNA (guanosine2251-2'-O)-methyltransferase